jgi:DeoR/GlpR family transcriptional regulator of sugar metabolism
VALRKGTGRLNASQRREQIRRLTSEQGLVNVEQLAESFDVTPSTIRRDLSLLTERGELARTYGGAIATGQDREATLGQRAAMAPAQKEQIARLAATFVSDGETLILDAGTTTGRLARRLRHRACLTVITNGMTTLGELADAEGVQVICLGGDLRQISQGFVGPLAELCLSRLTADRAFLGADALDARFGICEASPVQTRLKELMISRADQVYVLADSSKLGRTPFDAWAPIERPWTLITDCGASEEQLGPFRALREVTVLVAARGVGGDSHGTDGPKGTGELGERVALTESAPSGNLSLTRSGPGGRQLGGLAERLDQAEVTGLSGSRDVERGAVVHRGPDHRQPDGDVNARLEPHYLHRAVTLVVVHRDHEIEVTPPGAEEHRVRRQRPGGVDALGLGTLDARRHLLLLLAAPEQAVLARMRVNAADGDARTCDTGADERLMSPLDRPVNESWLDLLDHVEQADVGRDMDDPYPGAGEHHRYFWGAGQIGEHLGVARVLVPGHVQGFLVQRGGADGVHPLVDR